MTVDSAIIRSLRRAERRVRDANEHREQTIRDAVEAGGSYREVAALAGVSHQTVANIVNRQTDR